MRAEEDASERTRNSIVTRSRVAIELKPHRPIVVRKKTRTISFNKLQSSEPSISQLSQFFFFLDTCGHKMDSARRKLLILITVVKLFYKLYFRLKQFSFIFPMHRFITTVSLKVNPFINSTVADWYKFIESIACNPLFHILYVAYPLSTPLHYILGLLCVTLYTLTKSHSR